MCEVVVFDFPSCRPIGRIRPLRLLPLERFLLSIAAILISLSALRSLLLRCRCLPWDWFLGSLIASRVDLHIIAGVKARLMCDLRSYGLEAGSYRVAGRLKLGSAGANASRIQIFLSRLNVETRPLALCTILDKSSFVTSSWSKMTW